MQLLRNIYNFVMLLARVGWMILIGFPQAAFTDTTIIYGLVATLCLFYVYLFVIQNDIPGEQYPKGSFCNLDGVVAFFKNPRAVLIGWVHYLAFDLMVGLWIKNDALALGINFWLIVPCLLFTFILGPVGLLLYLVLRYTVL